MPASAASILSLYQVHEGMLCVHRYAEELRQRQGTEEEEKEEQESLLQEGGRRRCASETMHMCCFSCCMSDADLYCSTRCRSAISA